jgi:hypothetical protein
MEEFVTNAGDKLTVHSLEDCRGPVCPIHNPTPHHMRDWPMIWRGDRQIFERVCEHGIGHPDPDDQEAKLFINGFMDGVHGCDTCCHRPREGDWINAEGYLDGQPRSGFLHRVCLASPGEFVYYAEDRQGNFCRIKFSTAFNSEEHEYSMVDFDPEVP